jgi:hypothetical protein
MDIIIINENYYTTEQQKIIKKLDFISKKIINYAFKISLYLVSFMIGNIIGYYLAKFICYKIDIIYLD